MSEHADQLVLEYLSRAADVAHRHLGSQERLDFMIRLRRRIEEYRVKAGGATTPDEVRRVLARFGDPEALVLRERRRLDAVASGSGRSDAGGSAGATPPPPPAVPRPRTDQTAKTASGGAPGPPAAVPVGSDGAIELDMLFRHRPMEVGAIGLLGFGGLLLPSPLWFFGAVIVMVCTAWTARDKLIGLAVPPMVAVAIMATRGQLADALTADAPLSLRLAGPAGAIYLGWRLLRALGVRTVRLTRARDRP
jgi:hypothetical protein